MYSHLEMSLVKNRNIFNPFLFSNMKSATDIIENKINQKQRILIYAFNDMDSVFSVAILFLMISYLNTEVEFIIQDLSCEDKYSKLENQIGFLDCRLLILIGNNYDDYYITRMKMNLNIDVILINNEQKKHFNGKIIHITPFDDNSIYPFRDLNLLVIVYKFTQAISSRYKIRVYKKYLDILVLKFIYDDKELKGENLELYNEGINKIVKTNNVGILSMVKRMEIDNINYDAIKIISESIYRFYDLKFEKSIDKINNIKILIELLTTNSNDRAEQIVKYFYNLCLIKNNKED